MMMHQSARMAWNIPLCTHLAKQNGKIVHERYMGSGSVDGIRSAWSATKSMCASMFGIAVEQGWADVNDLVRSRNEGTRPDHHY